MFMKPIYLCAVNHTFIVLYSDKVLIKESRSTLYSGELKQMSQCYEVMEFKYPFSLGLYFVFILSLENAMD